MTRLNVQNIHKYKQFHCINMTTKKGDTTTKRLIITSTVTYYLVNRLKKVLNNSLWTLTKKTRWTIELKHTKQCGTLLFLFSVSQNFATKKFRRRKEMQLPNHTILVWGHFSGVCENNLHMRISV